MGIEDFDGVLRCAFCNADIKGGRVCNCQEKKSFGYCGSRADKTHCEHWWDGGKCCSCGSPAMTDEEIHKQGMDFGGDDGR